MRMSPFSKVGMSPSGRVGEVDGRGILAMSSAERERLLVIGQVASKVLRQRLAAERLGFAFGRRSGLFGPIGNGATRDLFRVGEGGRRIVVWTRAWRIGWNAFFWARTRISGRRWRRGAGGAGRDRGVARDGSAASDRTRGVETEAAAR